MHVAPNGKVTQVKIVNSENRLFGREVIRALSMWTYRPEPVRFVSEYELVFDPRNIDRSPPKVQRPPIVPL